MAGQGNAGGVGSSAAYASGGGGGAGGAGKEAWSILCVLIYYFYYCCFCCCCCCYLRALVCKVFVFLMSVQAVLPVGPTEEMAASVSLSPLLALPSSMPGLC